MIYLLLVIALLVYFSLLIAQRYFELFPADKTGIYMPTNEFIRAAIKKNLFKKHNDTDLSKSSIWKISLIRGFKNFTLSFGIVTIFFTVLQLWLTISSYSGLAKASILEIEKRLHTANEFASLFEKNKFWPDLIVAGILIAAAGSWPIIERLKLRDRYKNLMKTAGFIVGLLTIAVCFSFYGREIRKNERGIEGELKLHELTIKEDNKLLLSQILEKVAQEVTQGVLDDSSILAGIQAKEAVNSNASALRNSKQFSIFTQFHQQDLSKNAFLWSVNNKDNILYTTVPTDGEFTNDFNQAFRERTGAWYNETNLSAEQVEKAERLFTEVTELDLPKSEVYRGYSEVVNKLIKKGYSLSLKKWINQSAKTIFSGVPFFGEMLDPVHEIIEDYITEKTKKLYKECFQKEADEVIVELTEVERGLGPEISASLRSGDALRKWTAEQKAVQIEIDRISDLLKSENKELDKFVEKYLVELKANSRWQQFRENFRTRVTEALASRTDNHFSESQWRDFDNVLDQWDNYITSNKMDWFIQKGNDLEKNFYHFIKDNDMAVAAWGYILQQEDWDECKKYFLDELRVSSVRSIPRSFLQYYCAKTELCQIKDLYSDGVDKKVEDLCPH